MFTPLVFWIRGFFQLGMPRSLCRFWPLIRRKTSFRVRMCILGSRKRNLAVCPIFPQKRKFSVNFRRYKKFLLNAGFNMEISSVNTPWSTSYAFESWMMNRQIIIIKLSYSFIKVVWHTWATWHRWIRQLVKTKYIRKVQEKWNICRPLQIKICS